MWKQWSLFIAGFVVILLPLLGVPTGAKRMFGLVVGAAITIIAFLIIREAHTSNVSFDEPDESSSHGSSSESFDVVSDA